MHTHALNLHEVVVFLVAAGIVVPLLRRAGINPVLGFLGVGLVIGPYGLGRFAAELPWLQSLVITDIEGVKALAELGVVFLLFMIGLELSVERLWVMRRSVFGLGAAQVVITGIAITLLALALGNALTAAIILGCAFALSSTAIVMGLLTENGRVGTPMGQTAFPILLFQDLAVLPILFIVAALGASGGESVWLTFAGAILQAAVAVVVIMLLGRIVIRPLFRVIGRGANREMFLAAVLLVVIGTAVATEKAGLSMALGAFLAGLLFAETEYRHAVEVDIEPFKGLLLALFFVSVGMGIDLANVVAQPVMLIMSVIGLFALKGGIIYVLARAFGRRQPVAAETALLLGQGGEFAFLVIGLAVSLTILPDATAQFMLIVTGISMLLTPLMAQLARRAALYLEQPDSDGDTGEHSGEDGLEGHVVIVGYGRVGRLLGSALASREIAYVALDNDPEMVAQHRVSGASIAYGDARQPRVLETVAIDKAAVLVVTINDPGATVRIVEAIRHGWPHLPIYARAVDGAHATRLFAAGASEVVPETIEASLQLSELVLAGSGLPDDAARKSSMRCVKMSGFVSKATRKQPTRYAIGCSHGLSTNTASKKFRSMAGNQNGQRKFWPFSKARLLRPSIFAVGGGLETSASAPRSKRPAAEQSPTQPTPRHHGSLHPQ